MSSGVWVPKYLGGSMSWWPNVWWLNVVCQNVGKPKGSVKPVAYLVTNLVFSLSLILSWSWTLSSWFWRELVSSSSPSPSVSARNIFLRVDSLAGCRHCSTIGCHPPANYFAAQPSSGAFWLIPFTQSAPWTFSPTSPPAYLPVDSSSWTRTTGGHRPCGRHGHRGCRWGHPRGPAAPGRWSTAPSSWGWQGQHLKWSRFEPGFGVVIWSTVAASLGLTSGHRSPTYCQEQTFLKYISKLNNFDPSKVG